MDNLHVGTGRGINGELLLKRAPDSSWPVICDVPGKLLLELYGRERLNDVIQSEHFY